MGKTLKLTIAILQSFYLQKPEKEQVSNYMKHKMLISLEKNIEHYAGEDISKKVMEGSEGITEKTDKKKVGLWTKEAMERLDSLVDEKTRIKIMNNCGSNCAEINKRVIQKAVARRKKFKTIEDFLKTEQEKPQRGTKIQFEGNQLFHIYTPQAFTFPMRRYCGLLRALPKDVRVSKTYCHCSEGFVKKYWESVLKRPVSVTLIESAISGASECKFAVKL